jgi:lipopolysaccharide export LptBFGC system permease protein LptF
MGLIKSWLRTYLFYCLGFVMWVLVGALITVFIEGPLAPVIATLIMVGLVMAILVRHAHG